MLTSLFITALVVVANVLGAGMIVPQFLQLLRTRSISGFSPTWAGVGVAMNLWWLAYGLQAELWGVLPVSGLSLVLYLAMAWVYMRIAGIGRLRDLATGGLAIAALPVGALVVGSWDAAGVAIGLCYAIQFAPAAYTAVRSSDVSGVSRPTWVMALVEALIWIVYGATILDPALLVGGAGGTIMATIILLRLRPAASSLDRRQLRPASLSN